MTINVQQIYTGSPLRNFSYLIENGESCFCLDPYDAKQVMDIIGIKKLKLKAIINTHEHYDHVMGNDQLQKMTRAPIWAFEKAKGKIKNIERFLSKDELLSLDGNNQSIKVLETPGHTTGHLSLLIESEQNKAVLTGDTLFNAGVGHCRMGGDVQTLFKTIDQQFFPLDDNFLVYPGHDYLENNLNFTLSIEPNNEAAIKLLKNVKASSADDFIVTTMKIERQINTFLRYKKAELRNCLTQILNLAVDKMTDEDVFCHLRKLRDDW